jgi:hypothetical protein
LGGGDGPEVGQPCPPGSPAASSPDCPSKAPASAPPPTTGKIERFHQSLRKEFLQDRTFDSLEAAQAALEAWVADYNTNRPHQALEMATTADRFRLTPVAKDASSIPVDHHEDQPGQWVLRRVASNGLVSVDNQMFSVGNAYKTQLVDVFVDDTVIQVWSNNQLIKTVAEWLGRRFGPRLTAPWRSTGKSHRPRR